MRNTRSHGLFKLSLLLTSDVGDHEFPSYGSYFKSLHGRFEPAPSQIFGRGGIVSGGEP